MTSPLERDTLKGVKRHIYLEWWQTFAPTCMMNYVNMQHNNVTIRLNYVKMQNTSTLSRMTPPPFFCLLRN